MSGDKKMNTFKFTLLILLTTFLMGSSFAVVKIGLPYSSPLLLAALRFTLAGFIMASDRYRFKKTASKHLKEIG